MSILSRISEIFSDSAERLENVIFGLCCLLTLVVFIYVIIKILISPTKPPKCELMIIALSCLQLFLGTWYYFIDNEPYINILNKAIKVLQCQVISWTCMHILIKGKKRYYWTFNVACTLYSLLLVYHLFRCFMKKEAVFYLKMNILSSVLWMVMSSFVFAIALVLRRKLKFAGLFKLGVHDVIDLEIQKVDKGDEIVETFTDSKFSQFFLLSGMEFGTSLVTFAWDVTIYVSVVKNNIMDFYDLNIPFFEELLHLVTNSLLILIPNWTIFFVFYWLQRRNYAKLSGRRDVMMSSIEYVEGDTRFINNFRFRSETSHFY